jgi:predicted Zn-dependent protease
MGRAQKSDVGIRGIRSRAVAKLAWALPLALFAAPLLSMPAAAQGLNLIRDAEIEDLLNIYSRPIFKAANLGSQRIRVRIIKDKSFNAFVLDGRNVFMNTGALVEAGTPNEVIGVLAHETGHIVGGHMAGLRTKLQREATANLLLKILGTAAAVATKESSVVTGSSTFADNLSQRSILSYRRAQEGAADQSGLQLLSATKQSAKGMIKTFERFAQQELFSDQQKDPYVVSHPMPQDRINQLSQAAARSLSYEAEDSPELQLRHDLMRAKLVGYISPQLALNRYPASDDSLPGQYGRAIGIAFTGGFKQALPKVDALIQQRPAYAYFWELKGDFLMKTGDFRGAIAPLRKALELSRGQPLIRVALAEALIGAQDNALLPEAVTLLRKGLVEEESSEGLRQLANAHFRMGDEPQAYLSSARATLLEGKLQEAKRFAKRAQALFPEGSPNWVKADDILSIKEPGE